MDEVFEHSGVAVRYKLRPAKQDRRHLVVVFAGVQGGKHDFFGFDGTALDHVKGTILWIKDSFESNNAYYLCAALDFKIEKAVAALIDSVLTCLKLEPSACTLLGGSKGASAALHLGLKYDYGNIIASVPQTAVGTYTRHKLKDTFTYMSGPDPDLSEATLNAYIPGLVAQPRSLDKNIYIISSEADPEFEVHIKPWLDNFARFHNFNILLTDSALVTAHPEVTPYNIPFILSTIYALCEGLAPRFGTVRNGNGKCDRERGSTPEPTGAPSGVAVAAFHWIQLRADVLQFRAYGAVLGQERLKKPSDPPALLAISGSERHRFNLESFEDRSLNSKLYRGHFLDYVWAGLRTPSDLGLSLESLPSGVFDLAASFAGQSGPEVAFLTSKQTRTTGICAGYAYQLDSSPERTRLTKTSLDGCVPDDGFFTYTNLEIVDSRLFLRGCFAVPREEMRRWNDGDFALTLFDGSASASYHLASSRVRHLENRPSIFDDEAYSWANFATPSNGGLALDDLPEGCYEGNVSFVRSGRVYKGSEQFFLVVAAGEQRIRVSPGVFASGTSL